MVISRPRLRLQRDLEPPITWAAISTRASLTHSVAAIDNSTAVRHTRPVFRRHWRRHLFRSQKMLGCMSVASLFNIAAKIVLVKSRRAGGLSVDDYHVLVPAAGTSASSVVRVNQIIFSTMRARASSVVPVGHGLSAVAGTRAFRAGPFGRGINWVIVVRAPTAALINTDTGTCTWFAPSRHTSRINIAAVTARRIVRRTCSSFNLPVRPV